MKTHRHSRILFGLLLGAAVFAHATPRLAAVPPAVTPNSPPVDQAKFARAREIIDNTVKNDELTQDEVQAYLSAYDWFRGSKSKTLGLWKVEHPETTNVHAKDVRDFLANADHHTTPNIDHPLGPDSHGSVPAPKKAANPKISFKVRQSYSDVLAAEDPTQADTAKVQKYDDLKGAAFSYTRDFNNNADIWSAQAAVILPIVFTPEPKGVERLLQSWGFVPSVEIYRVSGVNTKTLPAAGTDTKDIDQLAARLGIFGKFNLTEAAGVPADEPVVNATLRGYYTHTTDTGFRTSIPAGQVEFEPQVDLSPLGDRCKLFQKLALGYKVNVFPKNLDAPADDPDISWLSYQARLFARYQGGVILSNGNTTVPTGGFERIGPVAEFRLAPLINWRFSLTIDDQYLCTIDGPDNRQNLLTVSAEWKVLAKKPKEASPATVIGAADNANDSDPSVSLKAIYTRGGVDYTKQKVDTFQLGIGVTY